MLLWAERFDVRTPQPLVALRRRMIARAAVQTAMRQEGLDRLLEANVEAA
jgi:hypothetical protein